MWLEDGSYQDAPIVRTRKRQVMEQLAGIPHMLAARDRKDTK